MVFHIFYMLFLQVYFLFEKKKDNLNNKNHHHQVILFNNADKFFASR